MVVRAAVVIVASVSVVQRDISRPALHAEGKEATKQMMQRKEEDRGKEE